jgi:glycosyltransferase involved in cell wall biosynthesis
MRPDGRPGYASAVKVAMLAPPWIPVRPIRWPEPFGLVMVESLACGTPVIAFPEGSAPEVVEDGVTGFVVGDEHAMAQAIGRLDEIEPAACRDACERRFGVPAVVRGYEEVYRAAMSVRAQSGS